VGTNSRGVPTVGQSWSSS